MNSLPSTVNVWMSYLGDTKKDQATRLTFNDCQGEQNMYKQHDWSLKNKLKVLTAALRSQGLYPGQGKQAAFGFYFSILN